MNIESLFKKIGFEIQIIMFECKYPVLFTCTKNDDVYIFVCPVCDADRIEWLGTKTSYENLIELLNDKITIRNMFTSSKRSLVIEYNGELEKKEVSIYNVPEYMLPDEGEYMEVEEGEYVEEIAFFESKIIERKMKVSYDSLCVLDTSSKYFELFEQQQKTHLNIGTGVECNNLSPTQKVYKKIPMFNSQRIDELFFGEFSLVKEFSY